MFVNQLESLQICNFRNLENYRYDFSPRINCIFGNNGNGKTNLLEAIYFLFNHKSFRKKADFPQILSIDCAKPEILISSKIKETSGAHLAKSCKWHSNGQLEVFVNNQLSKKRLDHTLLLISPEDSFQFFSSRQNRKKWLDHMGTLFSGAYRKTLRDYNKSLLQRNVLLQRKTTQFKQQIQALDQQFAVLAEELIRVQKELLQQMQGLVNKTFQMLFHEGHQLELGLINQLECLEANKIRQKLMLNLDLDVAKGHTAQGPHLNDLQIYFDHKSCFDFCSLGRQKMIYLSLNFAGMQLLVDRASEQSPIILIDDLSGELDEERWERLTRFMERGSSQVFITSSNNAFQQLLMKIPEVSVIFLEKGHPLHQIPIKRLN